MNKKLKSFILPALTGTLLLSLFIFTIWILLHYSGFYVDKLIADDVKNLQTIFKKIDKSCGILGFEHDKNHVDFLNVVKFVGSEIGSMNLAHPEKWEGPYLQDNPTIQQKPYQIVKTRKGYYITPGDGVKLGNGKVVGKNIVMDYKSDIDSMVKDPEQLLSGGNPLAERIEMQYKLENPLEPLMGDEEN
jgi:hypothetical protein